MLYTILIIIFTLAIGYETYKGAHYQRSYAKMMTFERQRDMEAKLYYMAANPELYPAGIGGLAFPASVPTVFSGGLDVRDIAVALRGVAI